MAAQLGFFLPAALPDVRESCSTALALLWVLHGHVWLQLAVARAERQQPLVAYPFCLSHLLLSWKTMDGWQGQWTSLLALCATLRETVKLCFWLN